MSTSIIQLLVLAAIAVFLILRLRNVLGTREGFEKPPISKAEPLSRSPKHDFEVIEGGPDRDIIDHAPEGSDASVYGMTCANRLPEGTGFTCFDELG